MTISAIPVDQRVIDIDSRRFASIEKGLVELITNSDDSYARLEEGGARPSGRIRVKYERHQAGAVLVVADEAEGMSFAQTCRILAYGGAHSPLAQGGRGGRGYFGRGLKQAIFGLGYGWIETIHAGRFARVDLFRGEDGGYLYDDGGGDRPVHAADRERLGTTDDGTQVSIVVDNASVSVPHFHSLVQAVANNIYLRDVLARRTVELLNLRHGKALERSGPVRYDEPPAVPLLGPELAGRFEHGQQAYPFSLTLKRALDANLLPRGDERSNGLLVLSGTAVLDCQLFEFENQVGTEYLFGTVRCPALIDKLAQGVAVISDEREGLNLKEPLVAAFAAAVSRMIAPCVLAEQEKLRHLEHATTSGRTGHMIEHLLQRMNRAAVQDLHLAPVPAGAPMAAAQPAALRFTTPFYYRRPHHPFHVALLVDAGQLGGDAVLSIDYALPRSMRIEPRPATVALVEVGGSGRLEWRAVGEQAGARGEITVRAGLFWAWCEVVVAEQAGGHAHAAAGRAPRRRPARDHGAAMFLGYELRRLDDDRLRAVYSPAERKILINTAAPTVQLYLDGRGRFRDSARLLLAELFMDVIADELARRTLEGSARDGDGEALRAAKLEIIRRYGGEIHRAFMGT